MPEIQDIFHLYGKDYRQNYKLLSNKVKAMFDIEQPKEKLSAITLLQNLTSKDFTI